MKTTQQSILDATIADKQATINTEFVKEWQPFEEKYKRVKRALIIHFMDNKYQWQPTNDENSKKIFNVYTFQQIDNVLGLAYTSTGDYAGLWVCNAGYLWVNDTFYFIGFAINELGEVIGIAQDSKENEFFVKM